MIVKIGARDALEGLSVQEHVPDSRGAPTRGDCVHRRRIRSLSGLRHEDDYEIDDLSDFLMFETDGPKTAAKVVDSRSELESMRCSKVHGQSRSKLSFKDGYLQVGKDGELVEKLELDLNFGQSRLAMQGKNANTSFRQTSLGLVAGRYYEKPDSGLKLSNRRRQSSLHEHFRKKLVSTGGSANIKKVVTEIRVGGLSKHDGSPSSFKRKNMLGLDDFIEPQQGKVFPHIPDDDQVLGIKRPKIRNNDCLASVLGEDSVGNGLLGKKRASGCSRELDDRRVVLSPLKKRKVVSLPTLPIPSNEQEWKYTSGERHGKALIPSRAKKWPRMKKNGQPDARFKKVEAEGHRVGGRGISLSSQVPIQEKRVQYAGSHLKEMNLDDPNADKKKPRMTKSGRLDARFKNRGYLDTDREIDEGTHPIYSPHVHNQAVAGIPAEILVKKLPEVQKNGVRKPKRVQLKQIVDKSDLSFPSGNTEENSRVVKALWSPPNQMKHIAENKLVESSVLHRLVKCTKYVPAHKLDDWNLDEVHSGQLTPVGKDLGFSSVSDRTVSDCSLQNNNRPGQTIVAIMNGTTLPQNIHKSPETLVSLPLKARLREKCDDKKNKIALENSASVKTGCTGEADLSNISPKKAKFPTMIMQDIYHGELEAVSRNSETSPRTRQKLMSGLQFEVITTEMSEEDVNDQKTPTRSQMNFMSGEQIGEVPSGDYEGPNSVPRLTPRARKLTDAMQNFLHQKATLLLQWREMELGKMHPMALIGRSCKIFWPLDSEWYPGVIHEYNPQTRKHRIDYEDDEREWVHLGKERVKLHVSTEESKVLEMSFGEGSLMEHRKKLDADELAVLAAGIEGCQGELAHGDLVWAKIKGYPLWPAYVMDEEHASVSGLEPAPRERTVPVQFFGSYDHARINTKKVVPFSKGIVQKYHTKCKRPVFEQGLQEVERYLKECKLPEQMAQLQEEVIAVVNKRADDLTSTEETNEEDEGFGTDGRILAMQSSVGDASTFPLELGSLRVLTIGKIVKDSEQFHTENHIWTEGFIAIRKFASMKDPETMVEYKMEVMRHPTIPSLPLFRVTPEDDKVVEDTSASACWKKILIKIQRAKEKAGLCIASLLERKRQAFRSGPSMFGFGHRKVSKLIQALPNARVCSKFTSWIEKALPEDGAQQLPPAGYQPIEFEWKHLDRCNICCLDEEYADNQLLQCDKCRTMVHMYCYGELEPPDGDLWLCNLCRPGAPKRNPICCLCPVTGGAMKETTDGRWAHLTCAMWTPETCLVDVKRMEPVDGIKSIKKERWKLICTVCKIPYGACIQCSKPTCKVAFHPLCARAAGFCMEVLEDKFSSATDLEGGLQLLTYCKKHKIPGMQGGPRRQQALHAITAPHNSSTFIPPFNPSGCARGEPYSAACRRGHRQPEALAAALAKRFFVENRPYIVSGCQRNFLRRELKSGASLWSLHWKQPRAHISAAFEGTPNEDEADSVKTPQSMSERYRHMRSTLHERLTFGKSAIHGWGVFTKRSHNMGDMVIEYAGEIVRPIIADIRERRSYDSLVGAGTYMFRIDDERVVDATHAGSIAHLVNHSCEPNCYSRVVAASGDDHIIIFAKRDIQEGEELTYNYRFASKDELLTCYCACSGCRGFVNTSEPEEEPTRVIAPRSELTKWVVQ